MSTLDLIRSLRRTMAALREADGPVAVSRIARSLADELEADLAAGGRPRDYLEFRRDVRKSPDSRECTLGA